MPVVQLGGDSFDFSYSGIKAGAIRLAREEKIHVDGDPARMADFCAAFQNALFEQLFERLSQIWTRLHRDGEVMPEEVAVAGGVAANGTVRERVREWGVERGLVVRLPERRYCTDNAAMIAFAGLQRPDSAGDPRRVTARSRIG
jgi:N6-L-threonylcarbamoyladenine synthase